MFKICARTVLELGAELISSDVIAFYELVKNAFDAKSSTGAEIYFEVSMRRNDYLRFRQRALERSMSLGRLKSELLSAVGSFRSHESEQFSSAIVGATDAVELVEALDHFYISESRIIVADQGTGMSKSDLVENFLVIGTASRKREIDAALSAGRQVSEPAPYLGEKGIGRLSAMRLGSRLRVETATRDDEKFNVLDIDWSEFADLDVMLDAIELKPSDGGAKPESDWSGTRLTIAGLVSDWTFERVRELGRYNFARLTDPFSDSKRRPRIAIFWNGRRVPVARMERTLLDHAHASIKGRYRNGPTGPVFECSMDVVDLGFEHPRESERRVFRLPEFEGSITGTSRDIPVSALYDLGEFDFEAYWFNRRRLGAIDSIGDRNQVLALQRQWAGILLFRDGFRVFPYGEDEDDWLGLDRRAMGSTRYLLNKAQFVGRVTISRLGNPYLVDQTNREGLRVCSEQQAFLGLLHLAIQTSLRDFITDVHKRYRGQPIDLSEATTDVTKLERRAKNALVKIRRLSPASSATIEELQHILDTVRRLFDRATSRISEVENENRQMIQMAGVGLLVEVVAHELARASENALAALEALQDKEVSAQVDGLLRSLRSEMKSVNKRVRVLDPLSVSGRQRREIFLLNSLLADILNGHNLQFRRHRVSISEHYPPTSIRVRAVKGMLVQIFENLISNSLYWLAVRKQHDASFSAHISITLQTNPLSIVYEDNGRGVAVENQENVFRAFYSLKERSKRRGLGLYIARDCAEYHGGRLTLDDHVDANTGRLHRFILELPDEVLVP